jgi:hypothetical protein
MAYKQKYIGKVFRNARSIAVGLAGKKVAGKQYATPKG